MFQMRSDWFIFGFEVVSNVSDDVEEDVGLGVDEIRGRGGSDEIRNGIRVLVDYGLFFGQMVIEEILGYGSEYGGEVGVLSGYDSVEVGIERGVIVEVELVELKEDGVESDERDVVRMEVYYYFFVVVVQDLRVGKGGYIRVNFDGNIIGVVEDVVSEVLVVGVLDLVGERVVYEGGLEEGEDYGGNNVVMFSDSVDGKSSSDSQEYYLVE